MDLAQGRRVILASASPRRKELLTHIIADFDVIPSSIDETVYGTPFQQVKRLAEDKTGQVAAMHDDALVIGADTLVFLRGKPLGKPADEADAKRMLGMLSGRTHRVLTGVCVAVGEQMHSAATCTCVRFAPLTQYEIDAYVHTGEPMDKAGSYGIQGVFSKHIQWIKGCYFNVVGLPMNLLYKLLKQF